MRAVPGMTVVVPADDVEARAATRCAYATDGPFYLRFGRLAAPVINDPETYEFELGRAIVMREGTDVSIVACGLMVSAALEAAEALEAEGISAEVRQAVARHTVGACDMTPLDMVVFTADAIEPGRRGDYAERLRAMVGREPLEELFFQTFAQGLVYVISGGRYLYPTAIDIYNAYAARRARP